MPYKRLPAISKVITLAWIFFVIGHGHCHAISSRPQMTPAQKDEAAASYRKALKVQDEFHRLLRQGSACEKKGLYDGAIDSYLRARSLPHPASHLGTSAAVRVYLKKKAYAPIIRLMDDWKSDVEKYRKLYSRPDELLKHLEDEKRMYVLESQKNYLTPINYYENRLGQKTKDEKTTVNETAIEGTERENLIRLYENARMFDKALEQVRFFTRFRGYDELEKKEATLLRKMQAPPQELEAIERRELEIAKMDDQLRGIEFELSDDGLEGEMKKALKEEYYGNYKSALKMNLSLLNKKEEAIKKLGLNGWAMYYPSIQRLAERTGDREQERRALTWIYENFAKSYPYDEYYETLKYLSPEVQRHINERIHAVLNPMEKLSEPDSQVPADLRFDGLYCAKEEPSGAYGPCLRFFDNGKIYAMYENDKPSKIAERIPNENDKGIYPYPHVSDPGATFKRYGLFLGQYQVKGNLITMDFAGFFQKGLLKSDVIEAMWQEKEILSWGENKYKFTPLKFKYE